MEYDADMALVNEMENHHDYANYDAQVYGEG